MHCLNLNGNEVTQCSDMATRGKQTVSEIDKAYTAGMLDADGSICISKARIETINRIIESGSSGRLVSPRYVVYVNIVNIDLGLMHWLVSTFGGRFNLRKVKDPERHRQVYDWRLQNSATELFLRLVSPYLKIKKERALLALKYFDEAIPYPKGTGAKLPAEEVIRRETLYLSMKMLNQLGVVQPQRLNS